MTKRPPHGENVEKWTTHGKKVVKGLQAGEHAPRKEINVAKRPPHGEKITKSPPYSRKKILDFPWGGGGGGERLLLYFTDLHMQIIGRTITWR